MNARQLGTGGDDSKGFAPGRSASGLRAALAAAGFAGAALLVVATFTTIIAITVETTTRGVDFDAAQSGWDRHGPALIILALLAIWLLPAALRGTRIAMTAVALAGLVALAIAVQADRPHIHDTGSVGEVYTEATANPGTGYYLETLGGVLLVLSGGALLVFGRARIEPAVRSQRA